MTPFHALANAIVETAVKDYKEALKASFLHPTRREYDHDVEELERFFRSGWYGMLTDLDGECLMSGVRSLVRKEMAE